MILTDDNFGTLVRAVELGQGLRQGHRVRPLPDDPLLALVMLFVAASVFDINDGVA